MAPSSSDPQTRSELSVVIATIGTWIVFRVRVGLGRCLDKVKPHKLFVRVNGGAMHNVGFEDFVQLVEAFGFVERGSRGSHRFFARPGVAELLNLQPMKGEAKPYQIRQFLQLIEAYHLGLEE